MSDRARHRRHRRHRRSHCRARWSQAAGAAWRPGGAPSRLAGAGRGAGRGQGPSAAVRRARYRRADAGARRAARRVRATIDLLVNNAGCARRMRPRRKPISRWQTMIATNVTALVSPAPTARRRSRPDPFAVRARDGVRAERGDAVDGGDRANTGDRAAAVQLRLPSGLRLAVARRRGEGRITRSCSRATSPGRSGASTATGWCARSEPTPVTGASSRSTPALFEADAADLGSAGEPRAGLRRDPAARRSTSPFRTRRCSACGRSPARATSASSRGGDRRSRGFAGDFATSRAWWSSTPGQRSFRMDVTVRGA